ncbi:MAG TPA: hypothetical protein VF463_10830 [Sphingobium sp.]
MVIEAGLLARFGRGGQPGERVGTFLRRAEILSIHKGLRLADRSSRQIVIGGPLGAAMGAGHDGDCDVHGDAGGRHGNGPATVGAISDALRPEYGEGSLRIATMLMAFPTALMVYLASRHCPAEHAAATRRAADGGRVPVRMMSVRCPWRCRIEGVIGP